MRFLASRESFIRLNSNFLTAADVKKSCVAGRKGLIYSSSVCSSAAYICFGPLGRFLFKIIFKPSSAEGSALRRWLYCDVYSVATFFSDKSVAKD